MEEQPYALPRRLGREELEEAFVAAWYQVAAFFLMLKDAARRGSLLHSVDDTRKFYSFGP